MIPRLKHVEPLCSHLSILLKNESVSPIWTWNALSKLASCSVGDSWNMWDGCGKPLAHLHWVRIISMNAGCITPHFVTNQAGYFQWFLDAFIVSRSSGEVEIDVLVSSISAETARNKIRSERRSEHQITLWWSVACCNVEIEEHCQFTSMLCLAELKTRQVRVRHVTQTFSPGGLSQSRDEHYYGN